MTLYYLRYNNYYNRLIKREESVVDYLPYLIRSQTGVWNWNPADGVDTEVIMAQWTYDTPDYLVVADDEDNIVSRWFVVDADYLLKSQYRVRLHRDVIADNYTSVMNSVCFVEKGYVNGSNPLIFNKENMGFNQIKTAEKLLTNNLKTPWLVLYLSRYHTNEEGGYEYNTFSGSFIDEENATNTDYVLDSLSDYKYYQFSAESGSNYYEYIRDNDVEFNVRYRRWSNDTGSTTIGMDLNITNSGTTSTYNSGVPSDAPLYPYNRSASISNATTYWNNMLTTYKTGDSTSSSDGLPINTYTSLGNEEGASILNTESGKTIRVGSTIYRIVVTTDYEYAGVVQQVAVAQGSSLYNTILSNSYGPAGITTTGYTIPTPRIEWGHYTYRIQISFVETNITDSPIQYNIPYTGSVTTDSAYEIIATPYYDVQFVDGTLSFQHIGRIGLQWFQDIINRYNAAGWAYDLQLVPYCSVDTSNISAFNTVYLTQKSGDETLYYAVAFKLPSASFSATYYTSLPDINTDNKISNETQLYRFVSPNGVGEYEFSPSKNGGFTGFEIDCTLIPFNPYIKINPIFGGLYGADFNDYRGLILGGDFSMPILNNSWSTYALNNKNYQAIFDRQIQSQEYSNKYAMISDIVGAASGAIGGAVSGGMSGPGGAIAGGLASAAGGVADVVINQKLRSEQLSLQKDVFGMELGTVKARADSLSRGAVYNVNNKYFPYVEYYTCTDTELEALEYKLQYTGMTVGVIGVLQTYINPSAEWTYVQAKVIDIDIEDDAHMASTINTELQGGVRIV